MQSKNTIELNGNRYDVASGRVVSSNTTAQPASKTIDGFFRNPKLKSIATDSPQKISVLTPAAAHAPAVPAPRPKTVRIHAANHTKAHTPQSAITLMRSAVKRPEQGLKQKIHVQTGLQSKVASTITVKHSAYSLDENRLARAKEVSRSPQISRHAAVNKLVPGSMQPLAVKPVPTKPEASVPAAPPAPQQTNKPLDMFEHAIANASHFVDVKAHRRQFKKHRRNHALSFAAGGLVLIVIAAFAAYQNSPSLQLKVASLRSGVSAGTPNFQASGFSYNGTAAQNGKLVIGLKNQQGTYSVSQQDTNWSNADMIQNVGATDASGFPTYSTVQAGNTTVYRLDNDSATWVANGKWYQVAGNSSLSNSQVTALVKNL